MDHDTFVEVLARMEEVNSEISKLDPAVRAEAFSKLKPYICGSPMREEVPAVREELPPPVPDEAAGELFTRYGTSKPSENALVAAAHLYSQAGARPFSISELRKIGDEAGLTLPDRLDMTISVAKRNGKALFHRVGKDQYKPTVHGEAHFKSAYGVRKGTAATAGN